MDTVNDIRDDLPPCSRYFWLPASCTHLITSPVGVTVGALVIPPDSCQGGYYGHDGLDPHEVMMNGLPTRGSNWDLLDHVEQAGGSAFRGTTKQVTYPDGGGAAAWADEGGHVFEITNAPTWDVNKHLQGRRMVSDLAVGRQRFGGNLALG